MNGSHAIFYFSDSDRFKKKWLRRHLLGMENCSNNSRLQYTYSFIHRGESLLFITYTYEVNKSINAVSDGARLML
jgi:hypothetical protein